MWAFQERSLETQYWTTARHHHGFHRSPSHHRFLTHPHPPSSPSSSFHSSKEEESLHPTVPSYHAAGAIRVLLDHHDLAHCTSFWHVERTTSLQGLLFYIPTGILHAHSLQVFTYLCIKQYSADTISLFLAKREGGREGDGLPSAVYSVNWRPLVLQYPIPPIPPPSTPCRRERGRLAATWHGPSHERLPSSITCRYKRAQGEAMHPIYLDTFYISRSRYSYTRLDYHCCRNRKQPYL